VLHQVDPELRVARLYGLMIERGLFGTNGREKVDEFGSVDEADLALEALARVKRRKGYRDL
jgi:predicted DNA-binding WGR domain protein